MSIYLSHPTGNANVRCALRALYEADLLECYLTSVATFDQNIFGKLSKLPGAHELGRRRYDPMLYRLTKQLPSRELGRILSEKCGLRFLFQSEAAPFSVQSIYEQIDRASAKLLQTSAASAVYTYEDGADATLQTARDSGLTTFYELPTTYWQKTRELLCQEAELQPEWAATLPALLDSRRKLERKDRELELADHVIVPSRFAAESLPQEIQPKVQILPYGCPTPSHFKAKPQRSPTDKLRLLFVGNLSQGKGLSYLFEAVQLLGNQATLSIIGKKPKGCKALESELTKHNYLGTRPHAQVLEQMQAHDVLVLPTLLEGFGMVITEALSQSLPVITTAHSCAPEILEHGKSGFVIPIRNAEAIADAIDKLYKDTDRLQSMRAAAVETARQHAWSGYEQKLVQFVTSVITPGGQH